jgi:hypothetical protein
MEIVIAYDVQIACTNMGNRGIFEWRIVARTVRRFSL